MEHYISAYAFSVRNPNAEDVQYYPIDRIGQYDIFTIIHDCLNKEDLSEFNHSDKVSFKISSVTSENDDRAIYGHSIYGRYGISSEVVSTQDNSISHERTPDEADTMKHFFYFFMPKGETYGILLTQRIGNSGIYSKLSNAVISCIRDILPGSSVKFSLLKSKKALDELSDITQAKRIRLKGTKIPDNFMESLTEEGYLTEQTEEDYQVDIVIRAKRGGFLSLPSGLFNNSASDSDTTLLQEVESTEDNEIQGNIEIETVLKNGKKRMISVSDPTNIEMYYNITEVVGMKDGHPITEDIKNFCQELSKELSDEINKT